MEIHKGIRPIGRWYNSLFISTPGADVVNEPGRIISWNSAFPLANDPADVQSGDDGLLDVGEASFLASDIDYTGFMIDYGGEA